MLVFSYVRNDVKGIGKGSNQNTEYYTDNSNEDSEDYTDKPEEKLHTNQPKKSVNTKFPNQAGEGNAFATHP